MGMYFVLGLLYLFLVGREVMHGPDADAHAHSPYGEPLAGGVGHG
jgi:hypothetical protein